MVYFPYKMVLSFIAQCVVYHATRGKRVQRSWINPSLLDKSTNSTIPAYTICLRFLAYFSTIFFNFIISNIFLFFLLLNYFQLPLNILTQMVYNFYWISFFINYVLLIFFLYCWSFMYKCNLN